MVAKLIEPWFLFALVWSIGASCDGDSRKKMDQFLREKIKEEKVRYCVTGFGTFCIFQFLTFKLLYPNNL